MGTEADIPHTKGLLRYLVPTIESSLYRNGKLYTRRDRDGNDTEDVGYADEEVAVSVGNARMADDGDRRLLDPHGFELLHRPWENPGMDFFDHQEVVRRYYPQCEEIMAGVTGADRVYAFDHNIRWAAGKDSGRQIAGGQQVQAPIHCVHGDYTLTSAPQRLRDLTRPPGINDTLRKVLSGGESLLDGNEIERVLAENRRFALINLWRNIDSEPVARDPLALCDGQTVDVADLAVFEIHYHDRIGENYLAKYSPRHAWWCYPQMTRDEVLLIKQWDSAGGFARSKGARDDASGIQGSPCTFSFHTAYRDPASDPDARQRQSIEVRCVLIY